MSELKFCINCKFYRNSSRDIKPICQKATVKYDLVFGHEIYLTCEKARGSLVPNYFCGPEGRYFEEKTHE